MSLVYWLSKFSQEAILVELFLIGCVGVGYFGYLLTKKRRYGAAKNNIPDNVVRAFLIELISSAEGFRSQLFGEHKGGFTIPTANADAGAPNATPNLGALFSGAAQIAQAAGMTHAAGAPTATAGAPAAAAAAGAAPAEVKTLQTQLAAAVVKTEELTKAVTQLTTEKTELEKKVAAGGAVPAGDAGKQLAELNDKISKLESKLAEYEVIEDDLANLKKYQQENKQLKAQLEGKGITPAAVAAPAAAAPAPEAAAAAPAASPLAAAEATVTETKAAESFETLVDKVEESLANPAGASATDPAAAAAAKTTAPVADAPAALDAVVAAADSPLEPKPEKSDADLLNEFERMLSS